MLMLGVSVAVEAGEQVGILSPGVSVMQQEDLDLLLLEDDSFILLENTGPGAENYLVDQNGNYLIDENGNFLTA